MILTGKAKEAFEKWFDDYSQEHHQKEWLDYDLYLDEVYLPDELMNSLIIEWLDSVGIYASILHHPLSKGFSYFINTPERCYSNIFRTRQQANEKAIEKANEIYNERGN